MHFSLVLMEAILSTETSVNFRQPNTWPHSTHSAIQPPSLNCHKPAPGGVTGIHSADANSNSMNSRLRSGQWVFHWLMQFDRARVRHRVLTGNSVRHRVLTGNSARHRVLTGNSARHRVLTGNSARHRVLTGNSV